MKHKQFTSKNGFTIVELLIVIVVIGILAAITIVAFTGIQTRARNAAWVAEFNGYHKLFETYLGTFGKYPTMPIGNRYCLGDKNIKAADVNAAFSAPDADPSATPISAPFNDGGYCRDVYYPTSRHEASPALMAELDKVGRVDSKQKTSADFPSPRFGSIGVIVSYQAYTTSPDSGIWLGVMLNDKAGNCPSNINGRKYDYPESDTVYCEVRLPQAPF